MKRTQQIQYRIHNIKTEQFAVSEEIITSTRSDSKFKLRLEIDHLTDNIIYSSSRCEFLTKETEKTLLVVQVKCEFEIFSEDFETMKKDDKIILSKNLAENMLSITVGTLRGVVHCKTSDIGINTLIVPPIKIKDKAVKDDITLDLNYTNK